MTVEVFSTPMTFSMLTGLLCRNIPVQFLALRALEGGLRGRPFADGQWPTDLRTKSVTAGRVLGSACRESLRQVHSFVFFFFFFLFVDI